MTATSRKPVIPQPFVAGSYEKRPASAPLGGCTVRRCSLAQLPKIIAEQQLWNRPPSRTTLCKFRAAGLIAFVCIPGCRPLVDVPLTLARLRGYIKSK